MTVPTQQQFEDYLGLEAGFNGIDRQSIERESITRDNAASIIAAANKTLEDKFKALEATPVHRWLFRNGERSRLACRALVGEDAFSFWVGNVDPVALEQSYWQRATRHRTAEELAQMNQEKWGKLEAVTAADVERANSPERQLARYTDSIRWALSKTQGGFCFRTAKAFHGYFYGSRAKALVSSSAKALETARNQAAELLASLAELDRMGVELRSARRVELILDAIEREKATPQFRPIRRMDASAPERALAYDLWRTFRHYLEANKAQAIVRFMEYEGVQSVGLRDVQDWIQGWREQLQAQRASREPR